jgi:hypothetical protein
MTLQGITVAISLSGIKYFTSVLLTGAITQALQKLAPPDKTVSVGDIMLSSSEGVSNWAHDIKIYLSSGSLSSFNPQFTSLTQQENGQFTLVMTASKFTAKYTWTEHYDNQTCGLFGCHRVGDHVHETYNYSMGIGTMTITIVYQFLFNSDSNSWQLKLISAKAASSDLTPNIPKGSIVNQEQASGCFSTTFSSATETAVDTIDFSAPITNLIQPLFQSIPASGQLTENIVFQFPLGPSGLTFPNSGTSGIATGVTGDVTYKNKEGEVTAYSTTSAGTNPPQLPPPDIPANNHLNYFISDYTFNALLWAYFMAGDLVMTATPGNVPVAADMNTSNYQNGKLHALYDLYQDNPMTADIKVLEPPAVHFQLVYDLTPASMATLQSQLPGDAFTKLGNLKGEVFMDEPSFFKQLVNVLGETDADQYKTVIEAAAHNSYVAVVTHDIQVVLNVISNGNTIPVITFSVNETDVLQAFVLGVSGTTQTLQFQFQLMSDLTKATFISSTIPGIDGGDFGDIWNSVLQNVFANELAALGRNGIPLPRIKGFDFLFDKATITLEQGYASVLTDVQHVTDDGTLYLMSKPRVQLDTSVVWRPTYRDPALYPTRSA